MNDAVHVMIRNLKTGKVVAVSSPLPVAQWPFSAPPPETIIWRYGDYFKFETLFKNSKLYFRRADKLFDDKEGKFSEGNQNNLSGLFGNAFKELNLGNPEIIRSIQESLRSRAFLQCWHQNRKESQRMWDEYTETPESIVLVSTVGSLTAAVGTKCQGFGVNYIDERFPIPELHSSAPFAYKRLKYTYEQEFRLLHFLPANEHIYLDQPHDFSRLIQCEAKTFIHELRFHPLATLDFKRKVRDEIMDLNLHFPVVNSRISED